MNDIAQQTLADIQSRILTIRGVQVMLDRDLADLYGVEVKRLNEQVNRNIERFPERFMHQLSSKEFQELKSDLIKPGQEPSTQHLKSQIATSSWGGARKPPKVFTEQGISMLSAVLRSPTAIDVSIRIMDAFVAMRRALASLAPILNRIEAAERQQLLDRERQLSDQARNEERFTLILDAMQDKRFPPQKIFYEGQFYDAFEQMKKFIRMARSQLVVIDPYFDDSVLPLLAQKRATTNIVVVHNSRARLHGIDVQRFNEQYANSLVTRVNDTFHDRFLVIDNATLIHVGASLNHLGKKCFAFSLMDSSSIPDILARAT